MQFDIGPHVRDEVLEKYLMHRLTETEAASVEEHMLACPGCQSEAEEADEFIRLTRAALPAISRHPKARRFQPGLAWSGAAACAVLAAALTFGVFPLRDHVSGSTRSLEVRLYALRGPDAVIHARSGARIVLSLDTAGLPAGEHYVVRLVNSNGTVVWVGPQGPLHDPLRVSPGLQLPPDLYWVRLMNGDNLVREYGLRVD